MIRMIVLLCGLLVSVAHAETLYKCVDKRGVATYGSTPCMKGQRWAGTRDYVPEPPPTPTQLRERERRGKAESAYLSNLAGTGSRHPASHAVGARVPATAESSRCQAAKAHRQRVLDAIGLKRTHDLLRRLDEKVRAACR